MTVTIIVMVTNGSASDSVLKPTIRTDGNVYVKNVFTFFIRGTFSMF